MIGRQRLIEIADLLVGVDGVIGVVLGGSRARGDHMPESDVDLGLYYRPPLDVAALGRLARELAGPDAEVTRPGQWGPWVDGGAWLTIDGTAVDWIYRDLDRVDGAWELALLGRYSFHAQTGHPLGVPDFSYVGEVAHGVVLAERGDDLTRRKATFAEYPSALSDALVAGLQEADFLLTIAGKAVHRADTAYVAGCLFRALLLCAHALHGRAGRWLINEKGAVTGAGRLPNSPTGFAERAHGILGALGTDAGHLAAALDAAAELVADTERACRVGGEEPRSPAPKDGGAATGDDLDPPRS